MKGALIMQNNNTQKDKKAVISFDKIDLDDITDIDEIATAILGTVECCKNS
jgi:hypothetical protein